MTMTLEPDVVDRFWAKVDKRGPEDCWEWQACTDQFGYGQFRISRPRRAMVRSHRMTWHVANNAEIPDGCARKGWNNQRQSRVPHPFTMRTKKVLDFRRRSRYHNGKLRTASEADNSTVGRSRRVEAQASPPFLYHLSAGNRDT
jgi:hypothetical protein